MTESLKLSINGIVRELTEAEKLEILNAPYVIPQSPILRHQGLLALLSVGITDTLINQHIAEIEDPVLREQTRIRFNQPYWYRDSEFIEWGEIVFNLTPSQVDQLFSIAPTL